jgi:flagellar motility protein MotE (MotC chaperone)
MKPMPRLLPLVAVAIGGVLAVKALSDVAAAPQLFSASRARAEEAPPPAKHAATPPANGALATDAPGSARACAQSPSELAKAAGLSPGELQTLQNLGARRGQIDDRERMLDTQLQLLAAAETKVDAKMKALNGVKAEIKALLGQADQEQQTEIDRLVTVYEKMKPADAAAVFATLDDKVRIPVAAEIAKSKPAILAQILAKMPTIEAKKVTESLAHRYSAAQTLSDAAEAPPQGAAPAAGAAQPPAKLATADASAQPPGDGAAAKADDHGDAAAKPPIKIHMTVKKPQHPRRLLAHPRRDTPTLAAAKAARPPPHEPPSSPAAQAAVAALKPSQTSVPSPVTPPAKPAKPSPPPPGAPTVS